MSIFLTLFLASLLGIILLVGRRVLAEGDSRRYEEFDLVLQVPDIEEIKLSVVKNGKRYGYLLLVIGIRAYVLTLDFTKKQTRAFYKQISKRFKKKDTAAQTDVENGFLKKMSEYKDKIKEIKDKIREEEGLNN